MASIEELAQPTDFRPHCMALGEPELMAQQLVQQGAMHALTTLCEHGCTEQTAQDMLASLRSNMLVIEAVAREKGFRRLFTDADTQPEPTAEPDHGRALCLSALDALSVLMTGAPDKDSQQGKALEVLSKGIEAYEKATLPPPFGCAGVPACEPTDAEIVELALQHVVGGLEFDQETDLVKFARKLRAWPAGVQPSSNDQQEN